MAQRWIGIRASAAISLLGSLGALLFAGSMLFFVWLSPPVPAVAASPMPVKPTVLAGAGMFAVLAAWGVSTAVGLFGRRGWARVSILVYSTMMSLIGGVPVLMALVVPLPAPPGADPGLLSVTRWVIIGFYGVLTVIGVWWLVLFNLSHTKTYFATPEMETESGRPLSISMVAWYLLAGSLCILPMAFLHLPSMLLGVIFTGWAALGVYVALAAMQFCVGLGLLRLREWARIGAIGYFCVMAANGLVSIVPSRQEEMMRQVKLAWPWMSQPGQEMFQPELRWPIFLGMLVLAGLPIFFLHRRRAAFRAAPMIV